MKLYIIRYPATEFDLTKPAIQWRLSEKGRRQAEYIAHLSWWEEVTRLYTSTDIKGVEAGQIIRRFHSSLFLKPLPKLNEVAQPISSVSNEEYLTRVKRFFGDPLQPPAPGWHSAGAIESAVVQTVDDIIRQQNRGEAAVLSHGLALTLYRAHILGRPATFNDYMLTSVGCWATIDTEQSSLIQDWVLPPENI